MKLRQAKKIVRRMRWRAILHPTDSERRARRLALRRCHIWRIEPVPGSALDTAKGRAYLRWISRSHQIQNLAREFIDKQNKMMIYGAGMVIEQPVVYGRSIIPLVPPI